jgi:plastocyanin
MRKIDIISTILLNPQSNITIERTVFTYIKENIFILIQSIIKRMKGSCNSGTSVRMTIFTTILSVGLFIGIVTSTFLASSSSFFQFNGKIITDAKAISNGGGIQGGVNQNLRSASTIDIPVGAPTAKNGQYYAPENAQLPVNSKVSWTNKDNIPHTSTANDNSFDTDIINPGDSSTPVTLSGSAGANIAYHCALHPWMKASITLSSSSSLPTAGQVQNVTSSTATKPTVTNNSNVPHLKDASLKVEKVISGLGSPTNMAFIKNNDFLILEKNGTVLRAINGTVSDKPLLIA